MGLRWNRWVRAAAAVGALLGGVVVAPRPAGAAASISGDGSSFAGIEFQQWEGDVAIQPYNLAVNYQSSSSGLGRSDFATNNVDFAVSDIRYNGIDDPSIPAASSFAYIPITAGGIAFMYNLQKEGFTSATPPIQLSSLTVCGIFGDAVSYWDDAAIKADNPGVNLPHVPITPVVRNDPAGTNYVMEQYCIATQPALYARFVNAWNSSPSSQGCSGRVCQFPTDQPTSSWPLLPPITSDTGSDGVANAVANTNNDGYIGAVETGYAIQHHFPVTSVKNDTGAYVAPTAAAVASALGHATQLDDGTQQLTFTPGDAAAYNPSTYSYMLVRLTGRSTDVGATITAFANYCLTLGEQEAPSLGYATINLSLIQFALNRLKAVPGYVPPTAAENAAIPTTGGNTNPDTLGTGTTTPAAGGGSSSSGGGGTSGGTGSVSGGGTAGGTAGGGSTGSGGATGSGAGATSSSAGSTSLGTGSTSSVTGSGATRARSGTGSSGALASLDPSAALGAPTGALGQTGVESDVLGVGGALLLLTGEVVRRRARLRAAV